MDQNDALQGQEAKPEQNEERQSMDALLEEEGGLQLDFPKQGEIRTGVIASIGESEILVSIGTKSEGIIPPREKEQIPPDELAELKVGMEIPVFVINPEDSSGSLLLSYIRAKEEQDWKTVEDMLASGGVHKGKIVGYNKGGLIVPIGKLRGFIPASQISIWRRPSESTADSPDSRWASMVGDEITVKVIEVDRQRHRLILSERSALQETRETIKDKLLDELNEGEVRLGRVTSLADFGAFVNIDGADGLVHLSEISWDRVDHPGDVLKVGQEVKVKIIALDRERKRIGLSIRQTLPDPWLKKIENLREGQLIEGTVTHLTKFGAFARLDEDLEGLIHVSELSEARVNHPKEVVKEGDVLILRIIKIDPERRRIGLSLRKVDSPAYADLDWKMELSGEVGGTQKADVAEEPQIPTGESDVQESAESDVQESAEVEDTQIPTAESDVQESAESDIQESAEVEDTQDAAADEENKEEA